MPLEATITLVDGADFEGTVPSGHAVRIGGVKVQDWENIGFRPLELFLLSLGACSGVSMTQFLRKKRQDVTGFRIELAGKKSDTVPPVFTRVDMEYVVIGKSISEKAVRSSMNLTEKNCSVMAMLKPSVLITSKYRIIEG
jgi:putative redox protein